MSGKMSRDKGARFELQIANYLKTEYGYSKAERTAQHSGKNGGDADVKGIPGLHIECKAQERMQLYSWMEQAERDVEDKGSSDVPVVIHKQNRKEILVSLSLDNFMKIYQEYASSMYLAGKEGEG